MPIAFNQNGRLAGIGYGQTNAQVIRDGYYVRTTGDDDTGDGSYAAPWATLTKAITVSNSTPPTGGYIYVGTGTYTELKGANASWTPDLSFSAAVTIESETGRAADVIIGGDPLGNTVEVVLAGTISNCTFSKVTFEQQSALTVFMGSFSASCTVTSLAFHDCVWNMGTAINYAMVLAGGAWTSTSFRFLRCALNFTKPACLGIKLTTGGGSLAGFVVDSCTFNSTGAALGLKGFSGPDVRDSTFVLTDAGGANTAIVFGLAGDTELVSEYTPGYFRRNHVDASGGSYSHVCGCGANHPMNWIQNTIVGGDIFIKVNTGSVVSSNIMTAGYGIELKQAINAEITGNHVTSSAHECMEMPPDAAIGTTTGAVISGNFLNATGTGAKCYAISNALDANLGANVIVNGNALTTSGGGNVGDVRATTGITTLSGLQAAWDTYGDGSNSETDTLN